MNTNSYKHGIRRQVMKYIYNFGWMPDKATTLFREHESRIVQRKIKIMEQEGILKQNKQMQMTVFNEYPAKRQIYEKDMPKGYAEYYENVASLNKKDAYHSKQRKRKVDKDIESQIMMDNAKVRSLYGEKPLILNKESLIDLSIPTYYNSKELKMYCKNKESVKKYNATRMNGCMFSAGGIYPTYHVGNRIMEWKKVTEENIKRHIRWVAESKCNKDVEISSCIMLYSGEKVLSDILHCSVVKQKDNKTRQLMMIDFMYEHMYALPLSVKGEQMIEIMSTDGWKQRMLDDFIARENQAQYKNLTVACDGMESENGENVYTLLYCIPDLNKLKLFQSRAEIVENKKQFKVICFKHQIYLVAKELGNYAEIYTVDIEDYYKQYMQEIEEDS